MRQIGFRGRPIEILLRKDTVNCTDEDTIKHIHASTNTHTHTHTHTHTNAYLCTYNTALYFFYLCIC